MRKIFGIINCTPDSFYDGGVCNTEREATLHGLKLAEAGADILDIGGESTRPFSKPIEEAEELRRILPVITNLKKALSLPLSVDTRKPSVALRAIDAGASIINDITGLASPLMRKLIARSKVQAVVMHMKGHPGVMQENPTYPKGVVVELLEWFTERLELIHKEGISHEQIIIDPGIGFGKNVQDNLTILANISSFSSLGYPVMVGLSRKSFLQKILGKEAREVLSTTIALNTMSMLAGASLIRVHDVEEHRQVVDLLNYWKVSASIN